MAPDDERPGPGGPDPDAYEELRRRLKKFFEWRRCSSPDDLASEVLLRGLRRMQDTKIEKDLASYCFGIARNVVQEDRRAAAREPVEWPEQEPASPEHGVDTVETRMELRQVLNRLAKDERHLLTRYHLGSRDELRRELGLTAEALRVKVHRLQRRIQDQLRQIGPDRPLKRSGPK
jgi:RNA polymerase sigma factor (sigma-70 family)